MRWDTTRVAELPVGNSRSVVSLALSAAGVSQLGERPEYLRRHRQQFFGEWCARAVEQLHARWSGQQRPERFRVDPADQQHRRRPGSAPDHEPVWRGVRPVGGRGDEHRYEERHECLSGLGLRLSQQQRSECRSNLDKAAGRSERPSGSRRVRRHARRPADSRQDVLLRVLSAVDGSAAGAGTTLNGAPTAAGRAVLQAAAGDCRKSKPC